MVKVPCERSPGVSWDAYISAVLLAYCDSLSSSADTDAAMRACKEVYFV